MVYKLKKEFNICCSHRLYNEKLSEEENEVLFGKCSNFPSHGHNYKIIINLKCSRLNKHSGMVINFDNIKRIFKNKIDDVYDHKFLNDCPGFENKVPTAENMCKIFYDILKDSLPYLYAIEIYETDSASAIYEEN